MRIRIKHTTEYFFDSPVRLHPHVLRLWPIPTPAMEVETFSYHVQPVPSGQHEYLDPEGNRLAMVWFWGDTAHLWVESHVVVNTRPLNLQGMLLHPLAIHQFAAIRSHNWPAALQPALTMPAPLPGSIGQWVDSVLMGYENTMECLFHLTKSVGLRFQPQSRHEGSPWPPSTTWASHSASCRDLSWLLIQILRYLGLPARFVSGYHFAPHLPEHELHAWVEVFVPGGGWIGLDPSVGAPCDEAYIAVAGSIDPSQTMPITGAFTGNATARLEASVLLEAL